MRECTSHTGVTASSIAPNHHSRRRNTVFNNHPSAAAEVTLSSAVVARTPQTVSPSSQLEAPCTYTLSEKLYFRKFRKNVGNPSPSGERNPWAIRSRAHTEWMASSQKEKIGNASSETSRVAAYTSNAPTNHSQPAGDEPLPVADAMGGTAISPRSPGLETHQPLQHMHGNVDSHPDKETD